MILTAENLLDYLLERQLITLGAVVDGDYRVAPSTSRHATFRVHRRDAPGLFLKQPQQWDAETLRTVHREALCYELAAHHPAFAPLAPLLPPFHGFDPEHQVLALGLVGDGQSLGAHHQGTPGGSFPPWIGATLGRLLGRYHHDFRRLRDTARGSAPLPDHPPWILNAPRMAFAGAASGKRAAPQVLELIARDPSMGEALEGLRRSWSRETLIHGDLKLQNCVVAIRDGETAGGEIKVVDWELASFGEASWDVGSILQSYLVLWVLSMPWDNADGALSTEDRARSAALPLEAIRPLVQAFWHSYREHGGAGPDLLQRGLTATGARLLQTAFEYGAANREVHPNVVLLVQLASNILTQPLHAAAELLELEP
jgi:hypothetical protein